MSRIRTDIPDLRHDTDEITLDHCYVLLEYFGKSMDEIEGTTNTHSSIANAIHPDLVQESLQRFFNAKEFSRLFKTEVGKGFLVGVFAKDILAHAMEESESQEEY